MNKILDSGRLALQASVLALLVLVPAALVLRSHLAHAGESPFPAVCSIGPIANPSTGSSTTDADCVWVKGAWLTFQCDASVYYTKDNSTPTTSSPKATFPGDPYPIKTEGTSAAKPLKMLPVSGSATCVLFRADI